MIIVHVQSLGEDFNFFDALRLRSCQLKRCVKTALLKLLVTAQQERVVPAQPEHDITTEKWLYY